MTCIVGLVHDGKVYLGGDSLGCDLSTYSGVIRTDKKVFRHGKFLMGFTSSYRMGQLLQYKFASSRDIEHTEDVMSYMVNVFVEDVRTCLKDGGYAQSRENQESAGTFLVGFEGRLFKVDSDYQVGESLDRYDACGCGFGYAVGNMFSSLHLPPEARILQALAAAEHCSVGVKGPFTIVSM